MSSSIPSSSWAATATASPSSPSSTITAAAAAAPTDDPYYLLYMGIQATIPFALRNMAVQVALSSVVFTLYMILIFITRTRHRRTWTFGLATVVSALFFATAFTNSIQLAHALQRPGAKVEMGIEYGDVVLTLCLPWIGDWLIWLRMLSLWPAEDRTKPHYMVMFGAPVVLKLFRFGILCALLNMLYEQMATSLNAADLGTKVWPLSWLTWTEYGAMLIDVTICSAICIIRLTSLMKPKHSDRRSVVLQSRLRLLLANTASSFILPVVSAVIMIILGAAGTFDAYATMTKINAGVTAINVLIAIIIPILQNNASEDQRASNDPSQQANSFIRNKLRSGGGGGTNSNGRTPTASRRAVGTNGVIQTTMEESFVDHLDYGSQPYSPRSLGEKASALKVMYEDEHELTPRGGDDQQAHSQPHSQHAQARLRQLTDQSYLTGSQQGSGPSSPAGSGFEHTRSTLAVSPGGGGTYDGAPSAPVDLERGESGDGGAGVVHHYVMAQTTGVYDSEHNTSQPPTAASTPPAVGSGGGAGAGGAGGLLASAMSDEDTRDVLKTMPRLSRFGQ